jgi:hypothetical protein
MADLSPGACEAQAAAAAGAMLFAALRGVDLYLGIDPEQTRTGIGCRIGSFIAPPLGAG